MAPEQIAFSVGKLRFEAIDAPAERLAVYRDEGGELGPRLAIVIPPRTVHWTQKALEAWAPQFIAELIEAAG